MKSTEHGIGWILIFLYKNTNISFGFPPTIHTPHYEQVPFEVPANWEWTTLGELYNIISAKRVLQSEWMDRGIPFFRAREIVKLANEGHVNNELFITEEHYNNLKEIYGVPLVSDIMLSAVGTIGKNYVVSENDKFYYKDASVLCLQNIYNLYSTYFSLILEASCIQLQMYENSKGTTVDTITIEKANNYIIPVPPIGEQYRIVAEVEKWFTWIDAIEQEKADLQTAIKQIKSKILDLAIHGKLVPQDPNDEPASELLKRINPQAKITCDNGHDRKLPQGWCSTNLGTVGVWQSGGTPSRSNISYYGGGIPWLKTCDLNDGLITNIPESITEEAVANSSAKINPIGSVLIAMYGATIGKLGILTLPATTNQACCACIEFYGVTQLFLFYFLLSQKRVFISKGGGGAQPNISKEIIINTAIHLPPIAEQHRIVQKIEEIFSALDNIQQSLEV